MLFNKIKTSKVIFPDRNKYKIEYSDDLMDLITLLLNKNKNQRLGAINDVDEVLGHSFFKSIDLKAVYNKTLKPKFIPESSGDPSKFFNTSTDKSTIQDTYIPTKAKNEVLRN